MMCKNFDEKRKRCQQAKCDGCKNLAPSNEPIYEPYHIEGTGLGIDH